LTLSFYFDSVTIINSSKFDQLMLKVEIYKPVYWGYGFKITKGQTVIALSLYYIPTYEHCQKIATEQLKYCAV
jgi:hypothetical protein